MKYRAILDHADRFAIRLMCRALKISPAGYYAWRARPESERAKTNRALLTEIRGIHAESRRTYGSPSIWDALVQRGHRVGQNRVARLMRVDGIRAKTVKKWRATTDSAHKLPVAANTLDRQFTATESGAGASLRSRRAVCERRVPAPVGRGRHSLLDESQGELLGQRLRGELLCHTQEGADP